MLIYPPDANKRHKQNTDSYIKNVARTDQDMVELIIIYILCAFVDRLRERTKKKTLIICVEKEVPTQEHQRLSLTLLEHVCCWIAN